MVVDLRKTLIVMPAFNEEAAIGGVLAEVFKTNPGIKCLVVDDGSRDRTSQISRSAGAIVATLPYNLGVGGAMRVGFNYALANDFENVVQVDADGQHNPDDVSRLVAELRNADLVLGARFAGSGEYEARGPRKWAIVILAKILSRSAHSKLTDTTSGFRASGPRAVRLFAENYPAEYLGDTVESLVIAARVGFRITQVPVAMRTRAGGTPSHGSLKASVFLVRVGVAILFAFLRPPVTSRNGQFS
ncbi:glycosyltransferase family 2 protein [Alpinimonas psychrophila]|uniref:Glycosyltransferase involved in cell wall biosynthesis n=1 Tax=Alpinimonas psychrophila TaxID=748908 RepID=A0A7W3JUC9_9MICO|nr:glycosyltransferase family 2 protein [Alpinimonas psychrophila]MBA8829252.1 glycosyltransferase involved in cell wall biosynthesis [Alpinimonas psychrophila]